MEQTWQGADGQLVEVSGGPSEFIRVRRGEDVEDCTGR